MSAVMVVVLVFGIVVGGSGLWCWLWWWMRLCSGWWHFIRYYDILQKVWKKKFGEGSPGQKKTYFLDLFWKGSLNSL